MTATWRVRNGFALLWAGLAVSFLGSAFSTLAIPLMVIQATGSITQMGWMTAFHNSAGICVLLIGLFVDRVNPRKMLLCADILQMISAASVPLCWWWLGPRMPVLYVRVVTETALYWVFRLGFYRLLDAVLNRQSLMKANSRIDGTFAVTMVFGPLLAGYVCARFGGAAAIGLDALSYGVSALALIAMRLPPAARGREAVLLAPDGGLRAGFQFVLKSPLLKLGTVLAGGAAIIELTALDLLIFRLEKELGHGDTVVGYVMAAGSVGAVVGSALAPRLRLRFGFLRLFLGSLGIQASALLAASQVASPVAILFVAVVFMGCSFLHRTTWASVRQELTPRPLVGRVAAVVMSASQLPGLLAIPAIAWYASAQGCRSAFALVGGILVVITLGFGLWGPAYLELPPPAPP